MSTSLGIFLDTGESLKHVASVVEDITGCSFEVRQLDWGPIYQMHTFDTLIALLDDHGFEDDMDLPFTAYRVHLNLTPFDRSFRVSAFQPLHESMAVFLGARLADALRCRTMVVRNLQRHMASFTPESALVQTT